jgi:aminopeptidase N
VTTKQIEDYISTQSGIDFSNVFNQYLRTTQVPTFEYYFKNQKLVYHWINAVDKFDLPLKVTINGVETWLKPTTNWQAENIKKDKPTLVVDKNFYVTAFDITN